ncbi:hypothetical protein [Saccharothrix sp. Mg75]|uniref:hypothetical protein n=1 Tax=Saccharothrix sp. Mg75 TaxID=3445357 RepID=UPI003EEBB193
MRIARGVRNVLASAAVAAVAAGSVIAGAGTASAVGYSFTLCNYGSDYHSYAYFPARDIYSTVAWGNQCIVTTHSGGEVVGIVISSNNPEDSARSTPYYTTDVSNDVFHTYGSYWSPAVKAHAHR